MSPLASAKAIISSSVTMRAGQSWLPWTGPTASDQSPEPLVWTVEGGYESSRIESNRIVFFFAESPITIAYAADDVCNHSMRLGMSTNTIETLAVER